MLLDSIKNDLVILTGPLINENTSGEYIKPPKSPPRTLIHNCDQKLKLKPEQTKHSFKSKKTNTCNRKTCISHV